MIFDLKSGKRRRVVQIVFGFLAFIFFISFVGFGIGSDATGGIFDAIGLGGDDTSSTPQYDQQIEDAETTLQTEPRNEQALLALARYRYLSAVEGGVSQDPQTGQTSITEDARSDLEASVAAWADYLKTKPRNPDPSVAGNASQAFVLLGDADGASRAQRIVAESQDTASGWGQLAFYLYAAGRIAAGDAAARRAVAATDSAQRQAIKKNLAALSEQASKQKKALARQAEKSGEQGGQAGAQALEDPFGGLAGGSGLGTVPATPTP